MKYKVVLGSVRTDDGVVEEGQTLSLNQSDAQPLLEIGLVEEVEEHPDMSWTRKELDEYATENGVPEAPSLPRKQAVIDAIKEVSG